MAIQVLVDLSVGAAISNSTPFSYSVEFHHEIWYAHEDPWQLLKQNFVLSQSLSGVSCGAGGWVGVMSQVDGVGYVSPPGFGSELSD